MSNRCGKLDVAHAVTAHLGQRDFNTALLTGDAFILHALIFTAQAFIVFDRTKNTRTEKTITFRFERTIVNRLRLFDFTERPGENFLRARQRNTDLVERLRWRSGIKYVQKFL